MSWWMNAFRLVKTREGIASFCFNSEGKVMSVDMILTRESLNE